MRLGLVHSSKDRAPHGHSRGTVGWDIGAALQHGDDMRRWEFSMVHTAQHREVGGRRLQCGRYRAIASGIDAVTRRAIARVHLFAVGWICLCDGDGDFVGGLIGITHGRHQGDCNDCDDWIFQHTFLGSGYLDLFPNREPPTLCGEKPLDRAQSRSATVVSADRLEKQIKSEGDSTPCAGWTGCDREHTGGIPEAPTYLEKRGYDRHA